MATAPVPPAPREDSFLGHPRGMAYLAFTEAWERFSFYGMSGLLLLYMIQHLLQPGVAEGVQGLAALRAGMESVTGPLSNQAFASQLFSLYAGLVYFTPVFGGLLADRLLGQRRTVVLGALLMSAGHILMAFEAGFLWALAFLIVGTGCLKGNITAQVGHLYLCLPARFIPTHARFLRLMLNLMLYRMEAQGLDQPRCGYPVLFVLDEFAALGRLEVIEKAAGLMAGYGVKLWPILQDLGQLKRHYKESWETFLGNAGILQFFANADLTTLDWLSKRMGQIELVREPVPREQRQVAFV